MISYTWELVKTINDPHHVTGVRRGARVRYIPEVPQAGALVQPTALIKFVPVHWHLAIDPVEGEALLNAAVDVHAPQERWADEMVHNAGQGVADAIGTSKPTGEVIHA